MYWQATKHAGVIAAVLFLIWYVVAVERFDGWDVVRQEVFDADTGLAVQLVAHDAPFGGSWQYAVYVFKKRDNWLDQYRFWPSPVHIGATPGHLPKIEFDGNCYVVTVHADKVPGFMPTWGGPFQGRELCFNVVTDGT